MKCIGILFVTILCSNASAQDSATMGNGEHNWIITDGFSRSGDTLAFNEIKINGDGWLVVHAVVDGIPNGDQYLGATYLAKGIHNNVPVTIYRGIRTGESLLVMLHHDSVANKSFDFIHLPNGDVVDRAVFEGATLIGHIITAS